MASHYPQTTGSYLASVIKPSGWETGGYGQVWIGPGSDKKEEKYKKVVGVRKKTKNISGGESLFKVQRRTFSNKSVLQTKVLSN